MGRESFAQTRFVVRAVICGPSGYGKTNVLLSLLESPNGLRFENVYVYSKSLQSIGIWSECCRASADSGTFPTRTPPRSYRRETLCPIRSSCSTTCRATNRTRSANTSPWAGTRTWTAFTCVNRTCEYRNT